jgi:hypothetical protein
VNDPNEVPKQAPELKEDELTQVNGGAQSNVELMLNGIEGESQDAKHKNEIE